ncbi:VanZ family protein [Brachybacterium sacelli]|uniref:VanZ family protein n=1 Tax=Brachybacterium sacelli TaxID=173364 RepID=A0ABS4X581_9MICO|nr:VanZ family protein [Brachybacterium sacelli]MBP2383616.1 VanZ family protein [Brachybacterium sacelli]
MDAVVEYLHRLPHEIRRAGGSLPWRAGALVLALVANIGFYLPSIPSGVPGAGAPGLDKVVHFVVFALTVWAAGRLLAPRRRFPMGWVVLVAFAHALLIELIQLVLLPERGAEGADVLVDVIGIALGVGLWLGERLRRERAERPAPEIEEAEIPPVGTAGTAPASTEPDGAPTGAVTPR